MTHFLKMLFTWLALSSVLTGFAQARLVQTSSLARVVDSRRADILRLEKAEVSGHGLARPIADVLAEFTANPGSDQATRLLLALVHHDLYRDGLARPRFYLEADVVLDCLVESLSFPSTRVQELALTYLNERVVPERLIARSKDLCAAWNYTKDKELLAILGRLGTRDAKDLVSLVTRGETTVQDEVLAKLGNNELEDRLVAEFARESSAVKQGELALQLGYIASDQCIRALVRELRSPLTIAQGNAVYSLRYRIVLGLRRAFPGEPLFAEDLERVVQRTKNVERGADAEANSEGYMERVEEWAVAHFGITWHEPRPPFLLYRVKTVPVR